MPACHIAALIQFLAAFLPNQLPNNVPRKAMRDSADTWVSAAQIGVLDGVPVFKPHPCPALDIAATWEVDQ